MILPNSSYRTGERDRDRRNRRGERERGILPSYCIIHVSRYFPMFPSVLTSRSLPSTSSSDPHLTHRIDASMKVFPSFPFTQSEFSCKKISHACNGPRNPDRGHNCGPRTRDSSYRSSCFRSPCPCCHASSDPDRETVTNSSERMHRV